MRRLLDRVPSDLDTREGSVIWSALGPAASELEALYIALDWTLGNTFADTATRKYLILRAAERGITPYPATHAILRGEFNIDVPIGSRYSLEDLNYVVIERIGPGSYRVQCETAGGRGNEYLGRMIPIDYIQGLTTAELVELLIPGEDEEETEHLRQRYYDSLNAEAFGGNIKDYQEKVNALPGVGGCKVYPVWNGGGTVKLVIVAGNYAVPTEELIDQVQTAIDPTQNQGEGLGIAPIGHVVTVAPVTGVAVRIDAQITYQQNWDWERLQPYAEEVVDEYFAELAKGWAAAEALVVRISQLETRLLNLAGVLDVADTKLNGAGQNLILGVDDIPVRGEIHG